MVATLRRHQNPTIRAWVVVGVLAAIVGVVGGSWHTPQAPASHRLPLLVVAGLWVGAVLVETTVSLRRQTVNVGLTSWALVVGLAFTPRVAPVAFVVVVEVLRGALRRNSVVKVAFNACNIAVAAIAGGLTYAAVIAGRSPADPRGWMAATAAVLAFEACSSVGTFAVIAALGALDLRRVEVFLLPLIVVPPVNALLGIITIDAVWTERWVLVLVVAIPAGAVTFHRSYIALAARYANLELLYQFTQAVAGLSEEREVLTAVLGGMLDAFSCEVAQLVTAKDGAAVRYELRTAGVLTATDIADPSRVESLEQLLGGSDHAVHFSHTARLRPGGSLLEQFEEAVAARLPVDAGDIRVLIVGERVDGRAFGRSDLRFMQTLAAQSAVALRGTRLLDELRSEAASREHEALHDPLTQLGNRALFQRRTQAALLRRWPESRVAVMLLDLDGFKEINDTLGHPIGDVVLQEVALRLQRSVGVLGVPTRLGGDEFAVVVPSVVGAPEIKGLARSVAAAVSQPMDVGGLALTVQASIGIALCPDHGADTATLLKRADVAMYVAKGSIDRLAVYDPASDQHSTRRLLLASELRKAFATNSLDIYYQPKIDMQTDVLLGFEALLRWSHPIYGEVPPAEFVPVAEQAGLIDPVTWWVLAESLRQQRDWALRGFDVEVAVNISARSLLDGRLVDRLGRLLRSIGVAPERLTLEVTETSVMADQERSAAILDGVAAIGVRIAIDDFGTGYSSLSRLRELPVHEIKVDRSFVTSMLTSADNMAIVSSTVNLAISMGRMATAEGVEDHLTWETLRRMGCHAGQGFLMAAPMPAPDVLAWLTAVSDDGARVPTGAGITRFAQGA